MFTGIVEEIGTVTTIDRTRTGSSLEIKTPAIYVDAKIGDSISINGVCLSVVAIKDTILGFDVIPGTLSTTTLGGLKVNDAVNLERSLKADSRIGGHFVTGHVDYKARILDISMGQKGTSFKISLPGEFSKFVAEKGSVTLDGVSLTVVDVERGSFTVYLIPHTLKNTILGQKKKGVLANVELDLLAKYLAREAPKPGLQGLLKKYNYI